MLVLVHEFGHFYSAKKFGIRVDEFGFGFPPKLFGIKKGETEYTFNLLPIGGFVKIFGENPDDLSAMPAHAGQTGENKVDPDEDRKFYNKPAWQQAIVLFAGVFMNFILAWILFSIGLMSGFPTSINSKIDPSIIKNVHTIVVSVIPKSPAENAGLKSGDKIVSIKSGNNQTTYISPEIIKSFIMAKQNTEVNIGYMRGENIEINYTDVFLSESSNGKSLGISMDQRGIAKLSFFSALYKGMGFSFYVLKTTTLGLYGLISDAVQGNGSFAGVAGPVGMVGMVGDAYQFGFVHLLSFAGRISISLAIINLLPFPALDGGRLFFLLIEKIKGSRMNQKFVNYANISGFAVLILLMLVVTYKDIAKLFY